MRRRIGVLAVAVATVVVCFASMAPAGASYGSTSAVAFQINVAHNGHMSDPAIVPPLAQKWSVDVGSNPSYPLIAGGRVFILAGGSLYALDEATGGTAWTRRTSAFALAYDAGLVFTITFGGILQAIDASTGSSKWAIQEPGQYAFSAPPTADSGVVYVGGAGSGGTLYANAESDGHVLWTRAVENGDDSSPTLSAHRVFVGYVGPQVYSFDRVTGNLIWHYSGCCEGGGGATMPLYRGLLYDHDWAEGNFVFDASDGHLVDSYDSNLPPAFGGDTGVFLSGDSYSGTELVATDVDTGVTRWTFRGDGKLITAPIVVNNLAIVGSGAGRVYGLKLGTGHPAWRAAVPGGVRYMAAGEGLIVVPSGTSVTAFGPA